MSSAFIEAEKLTKHFPIEDHGEIKVLKGINLRIHPGERVLILGASGAGKSTLLHILGTLDRPSSGRVLYDGVEVFRWDDQRLAKFRREVIGFVFQFHHLLPEFTALENVALPAMIAGKSMTSARRVAMRLLDELGLSDRANHHPSELSGGEQQRVAVARALVNNPKILLADEPSGNLDSESAHRLHELLWSLNRTRQLTLVIVSHNEELAAGAERVLRIVDGIIQEV
ncbi:MAG: ABC transporter ATP-binding protein [Bacteroidota bacterium]